MVQIDIPSDKVAEFCRRYRIRELSLFGSVLREDFRSDSDVDALVQLDLHKRKSRTKRRGQSSTLETDFY
jgi:predicted nucleotidyltransferase